MTSPLRDLCRRWQEWAAGADKPEDGWQSDFPAWNELMEAAIAVMARGSLSDDELSDIELCWAISEETENLADYAREHLDQCWDTLRRLARSDDPAVRWQVYDVLGSAGRRADDLLRRAIEDPDPYSRRRAILSLARIHPPDAKRLAQRFAHDDDPYIRTAALELARS